MNISIFGLGYVGAVSLGCLARDGHHVYGVDIDQTKLDLIASGKSPIIENGMPELIEQVAASGLVTVTQDVAGAMAATEVSFICVGTPSQANGSQDQSAVLRLAEQLGDAMRELDKYHVFVFRSTLVPGSVEDILTPIMEEHSGKKAGVDFDLCFQPEFLREGTSIKDYDNPPQTVVGTNEQRPADKVKEIFGHLPCEFRITSVRTAETVKYFCNIFHALKITFANEVGRLCQGFEVDSHEVMNLLCEDTQLNISRAYMRPGFAFGGSCLPKDLRAMVHLSKMRDIEIPMLANVLPSNDNHIQHAVNMVLASGKRKVAMIGLSFKSGTDDLRESPLVTVAEHFIGKGLELQIYDPEVNLSRLLGANKRFIENAIPHIGRVLTDDCDAMLKEADVIVVGLSDAEPIAKLKELARPDQLVVDLVSMQGSEDLPCEYRGAAW